MAFITAHSSFNPDDQSAPVIGIAADLGQHDSGRHHHARHQLLFANQGCITIELADTLCVLPPTRAAWIPAGTVHRAMMRGVVAYRSLYFAQTAAPTLPLGVLEVNPLLREVIERMAFWPWEMTVQAQQSLLTVCEEELLAAPRQVWQLPFPRDARLATWLDGVRGGALPERLAQLASRVAASERTLGRIFLRETGMSYQAWRQQWRLLRAMELLAESGSLSQTAQALDFASDSAFIAFFRQHTGQTPLRYLNHGAPPRR